MKSIIKPGPKKEKNKKKRNSGPVNTKDHDEAQKAEDHDLPRPSVGLQITRVLFVLAAYFWSFAVWSLRALAKCFSAINDVTYNRTRQIVADKEGEIVKVEEEQRGASGPKATNFAKVCGPLPQPLSVHCPQYSILYIVIQLRFVFLFYMYLTSPLIYWQYQSTPMMTFTRSTIQIMPFWQLVFWTGSSPLTACPPAGRTAH